ncbi:MAG TPA: cation transporter [Alphaproteobacteria bacterium]|jgi:Co/Zn/Cd efflux system component
MTSDHAHDHHAHDHAHGAAPDDCCGHDHAHEQGSEPADKHGFSLLKGDCCPVDTVPAVDPAYRRVLWIALIVNGGMFAVEGIAGVNAHSVSLLADAVDFLGDAANYGISLYVLALAAAWRARSALLKGVSMGLFGLWVTGQAIYNAVFAVTPDAEVMGVIGVIAFAANLGVAALLYRYRTGDANMRSVWLCTRNDAIGNLAVLLAASGVFATGTRWPDLLVAAIMAGLALHAAFSVVRQSLGELKQARLHRSDPAAKAGT